MRWNLSIRRPRWRSLADGCSSLVCVSPRFFSSLPPSSPGLIVSSHYRTNFDDITEYLHRHGMQFRVRGHEINLRECFGCRPHNGKSDNMWKLFIHRDTGLFFCHRCGARGNWWDFKAKFGSTGILPSMVEGEGNGNTNRATTYTIDRISTTDGEDKRSVLTREDINLFSTPIAQFPTALEWLEKERGIRRETALHYRVGFVTEKFYDPDTKMSVDEPCVSFSWTSSSSRDPIRFKLRSIRDKTKMRLVPSGAGWGLFGMHTVPAEAKEIVLTEGEFDAMAVWQATGMPAVSLPNGCRSLPLEVLPLLERFTRIYLWMDDDVPGQEGAAKFAEKLGIERSFLVHTKSGTDTTLKDANEALLAGQNLRDLIARAQRKPHQQILTFEQLRNEIYRELVNPEQTAGVQSMFLPTFNRILKGHRRGELTIFTGPTGSGKTTVLSQLSLDFASQGVSTLWGSFEVRNHRLIKRMLSQLAATEIDSSNFDECAEVFRELPMYFLRFYGSTDLTEVMDAMDYAVYAHDVSHVIVDNLQFMTSGQSRGIDRFEHMDHAIEEFRRFASLKNIHVTLVIHPRKVDDEQELGLASIFGSAKATQEADNVIILQRGPHYRYLDIRKNRFDGELGKIPYTFDRSTSKIYELSEEEVRDLESG